MRSAGGEGASSCLQNPLRLLGLLVKLDVRVPKKLRWEKDGKNKIGKIYCVQPQNSHQVVQGEQDGDHADGEDVADDGDDPHDLLVGLGLVQSVQDAGVESAVRSGGDGSRVGLHADPGRAVGGVLNVSSSTSSAAPAAATPSAASVQHFTAF